MTKEQAISAVIDELKRNGYYNIKIGWSEKHSDGTFAVEVTYNWRLNAWEKNVHQIYHCVDTPNGIIATSAGYSLDYEERNKETGEHIKWV